MKSREDKLKEQVAYLGDPRHVPKWDNFFNKDFHKTLLQSMRAIIKQMRERDGGKEAAKLTEKAVDLYIDAVSKKDIIYVIILEAFFQMMILNTLPGYILMTRHQVASVLAMINAANEAEQKGIIIKN